MTPEERRDPVLIREMGARGLRMWWPSIQDLQVPVGAPSTSLAGYAYEANKRDTKFKHTIDCLPRAESVLVIGGGPTAGDKDKIEKALTGAEWDCILLCKNHLHEMYDTIMDFGTYAGCSFILVDSETNACWQLIDYPEGCELPIVWTACVWRLPRYLKPFRIYWAEFKPGHIAECFLKPDVPRIPYRTSAEAALWLAVEKCECKRLGVIGVEVFSEKYRQLRSDVIEILWNARRKGVEILDYSKFGTVAQWCETVWRTT